MIRRGFTKTELVVVLVILGGLMFCCAPFGFWPAELVVYLAIGWIPFLGRVGPQIEPDWGTVAIGCIALAVFAFGLHFFLRWLYAALPAKTAAAASPASQSATWRFRWTVSAVAIIVMLFVAGISMVGITHELAWMATAEEPLVRSGFSRRIGSAHNQLEMARSLELYSEQKAFLPPGTRLGQRGEALHGWQVSILPYVMPDLAEMIDRDRPWTDERNREAFSSQIKVFQFPETSAPTTDAEGYALSHYAANQHVIGGTRKLKLDEITDGTANTILLGEAAGNYKPWGHPRTGAIQPSELMPRPMALEARGRAARMSPWPTAASGSSATKLLPKSFERWPRRQAAICYPPITRSKITPPASSGPAPAARS